MRTAPKFTLSISKLDSGEVAILNQLTGGFASLKLKSMRKIKKAFSPWICSHEHLVFSKMSEAKTKELEAMLPKHRIAV